MNYENLENLLADNGCLLPCCFYDNRVVDNSISKICLYGICCPISSLCFGAFLLLLVPNADASFAYTGRSVAMNYPSLLVCWDVRCSLPWVRKIVCCNLLYGADSVCSKGHTGLHEASSLGMLNYAKMRVWAGDTVNKKNSYGLTSLHIACKEEKANIVSYLLSKEAKVSIKDDVGYTPMHYACKIGNTSIINELLVHRASLYDDLNEHPIDLLPSNSLKESILLRDDSRVGTTVSVDKSLFLDAVQSGLLSIVSEGLGIFSPNILVDTKDGIVSTSVLSLAVLNLQKMVALELLRCLMDKQEVPSQNDILEYGPILLRWAVEEGDIKLAKYLILDNSTDLTKCKFTSKALSLMHLAVIKEKFNMLWFLHQLNESKEINKRATDTISLTYMSTERLIPLDSFICEEAREKFFVDYDFSYENLSSNNFEFWFFYVRLEIPNIESKVSYYVKTFPILASVRDSHGHLAEDFATIANTKAIREAYLWYGRYRPMDLTAEHESATCYIFRAWDVNSLDEYKNPQRVAIKLMRDRSCWLREIQSRMVEFEEERVIKILRHYPEDTSEELLMQLSTTRSSSKELSKLEVEGMYTIVMPLADKNLFVSLKQERWAGRDLSEVKHIFTKIVHGVKALHDKKFIHADLKPLNIVRMNNNWMLIDMDACCHTGEDNTGIKSSSSIIPPEAIYAEQQTGNIFVRSDKTGNPLLSHESFDVWSLGCILYQMVNVEVRPLFQGDRDDNLSIRDSDPDNLWQLWRWDGSLKEQKLSLVADERAKNLLHRMLEKDYKKRIRIDQILCDPFLTNKKLNRLQEYDVFISYRVAADRKHAEVLYNMLTERNLKVWWDNVELNKGENLGKDFEESFCTGIVNSKAFICILSKDAISNWSSISSETIDNVLLEHRLACELHELGCVKRLFPILIGDFNSNNSQYEKFCAKPVVPPSIIVKSIEENLVRILNLASLGSPLKPNRPIKDVIDEIFKSQGHIFEGDSSSTFSICVHRIIDMITNIDMISKIDT